MPLLHASALRPQTQLNFQLQPNFLVAAQQAFLNKIALSADGSVIVIGRNEVQIDGVFNAGEAYIYEKNTCSWMQTRIPAPTNFKVASGEFGRSAGISKDGSTVVIGARRHVLNSNDGGGFAIFRKRAGVWTRVYQFLRNVNSDNVGFDLAVSETGTRLIVGRPGGFGSGIVFNETGTDFWQDEQFLLPSSAGTADQCGSRVDMLPDMSFAFTGNINDDIAGTNQGGATTYQRSGTSWSPVQNFVASVVAASGVEYGKDIAVSDDGVWLAVGDWAANLTATSAGMVAIFEKVAGTYTERQIVQNPTGAGLSQRFGEHIHINDDGTILTIGSRNLGVVHIYERIGTTFNFRETKSGGGQLGHGLSSDGHVLVIGGSPKSFLFYASPPVCPAYSSYATGLSPTIYYRFNETSGSSVVVDHSGASNATYMGSPTLEATGALVNESNAAIQLNGSTQYIDMDTAAPMANLFDDAGQSSFAGWVYPIGITGVGATLINRYLSSQVGWELVLTHETGDSRVRFVQQRLIDPDSWQTDQIIALNTWSFIAVVYDVADGAPKLYVNGVEVAVTGVASGAGTRGNDSPGETFVGRTGSGMNSFNGRFDEFKFFKNKLLTAVEIADLYCLGAAQPAVVAVEFDEGALQPSTVSLSAASQAFNHLIGINDDGSVIAIGRAEHDVGGTVDQGEVTVWEKGVCAYVSAVLDAPTPFAITAGEFGRCVAVSGDGSTIVVGARRHTGNTSDPGGASIWRKVSGVWSALQNITFGTNNALFGQSIDLSTTGDRIIIGRRTITFPDVGAGVVYFESTPNNWTVEQSLVPSSGQANDQVGERVAMSSDGAFALVGATDDDLASSNTGGASLWSRAGTVWTQIENFTASVTGANGANFGKDVALSDDGNDLIVADWDSSYNASAAGYVGIFDRSAGLTEKQILQRPGGASSNNTFGEHLQLSNDGSVLAIGSRALNTVYIYKKQSGHYLFSQQIAASGNRGFGLSGDGKRLVVGGDTDSDLYELELSSLATTYLAYANGLNPTIYYRFGETTGATVAVDQAGANAGNYVGSPTLGVVGAIANDTDTAVELDGFTQYISLGTPTVIDNMFDASGQSSFAIWVDYTGPDNVVAVLVDRHNSISVGWRLMQSWNTGDYRLIFEVKRASIADQFTVFAAPIVKNQWQPIAVTYDVASGSPSIYVDGVKQTVSQTLTGSGVYGNDAASPTFIGQFQDNTSRFTGRLDEAKFFKGSVLTPLQVANLACIGSASTVVG